MSEPIQEVVVQDEFLYHDPEKLHSTFGMERMSEEDAIRSERRSCSKCFPEDYEDVDEWKNVGVKDKP